MDIMTKIGFNFEIRPETLRRFKMAIKDSEYEHQSEFFRRKMIDLIEGRDFKQKRQLDEKLNMFLLKLSEMLDIFEHKLEEYYERSG